MDRLVFILSKCFQLTGVSISLYKKGEMIFSAGTEDFYPIRDTKEFRQRLIQTAQSQQVPLIGRDVHKVMFACAGGGDSFCFLGPVSTEHLNRIKVHRFYFDMGMRKGMEKQIPYLPLPRLLACVEIIAAELTGHTYTDEEILDANAIRDDSELTAEKKKSLERQDVMEEAAHHTYMEERKLLDCVREGRVEEALGMNARMDAEIGMMSKNETEQCRKLATVAIALSVRAAIDGGLSPAEAYQMSDDFLQKLDACNDVSTLIAMRNRAVREITTKVHDRLMKRKRSSYVERCCDYVNKNYRNKIYLTKIASELGISPSYLSRLFAREMGVTLQDYIVRIRIEYAANLLRFSNESISTILHFYSATFCIVGLQLRRRPSSRFLRDRFSIEFRGQKYYNTYHMSICQEIWPLKKYIDK